MYYSFFVIVLVCVSIFFLFVYKKTTPKKEVFKYTNSLDGIDAIYWINLDRSTDRKQRMEKMFEDPVFAGKKIIRVSAVDGKAHDIDHVLNTSFQGMKQNKFTKVEYACLSSHLNAIKQFSQSNDKIALIMEDDMTLEFKPYWKMSVKQIMDNAPSDWEIIQLCYNSNSGIPLKKYTRYKNGNFACAGAYVLNKNKTITNFKSLPQNHSHEADHYLFNKFNTYAYKYPMFIYGTNEISTIHQNHVNGHDKSKHMIINKLYANQK